MEVIGFLKVTTESPKCFNETFLIFVKAMSQQLVDNSGF